MKEKNKKNKIILLLCASCIILLVIVTIVVYTMNENKIAILGYHGVMPKEINTSGSKLI